MACSKCGKDGHNRATCSGKKASHNQKKVSRDNREIGWQIPITPISGSRVIPHVKIPEGEWPYKNVRKPLNPKLYDVIVDSYARGKITSKQANALFRKNHDDCWLGEDHDAERRKGGYGLWHVLNVEEMGIIRPLVD